MACGGTHIYCCILPSLNRLWMGIRYFSLQNDDVHQDELELSKKHRREEEQQNTLAI